MKRRIKAKKNTFVRRVLSVFYGCRLYTCPLSVFVPSSFSLYQIAFVLVTFSTTILLLHSTFQRSLGVSHMSRSLSDPFRPPLFARHYSTLKRLAQFVCNSFVVV